jgi:hypothetical protein
LLTAINKSQIKTLCKRNWQKYDKARLLALLSEVGWDIQDDTVQGFWNTFKEKINFVESPLPMSNESTIDLNSCVPTNIKYKNKKAK